MIASRSARLLLYGAQPRPSAEGKQGAPAGLREPYFVRGLLRGPGRPESPDRAGDPLSPILGRGRGKYQDGGEKPWAGGSHVR